MATPVIAHVRGQEQLILLPVDQKTYDVPTVMNQTFSLSTGRQAVVLSGYAEVPGGVFIAPPAGDDDEFITDVEMAVGPSWIDIVQVSATVTVSEIVSLDTDEVDASAWGVTECTWGTTGRNPDGRILLRCKVLLRGESNGFRALAYHLVATGTLDPLPSLSSLSVDLP
jgi:hypothetical protein